MLRLIQSGTLLKRQANPQTLPAGARLLSTRALARTLGVSRNTVLNAYDALAADALLAARRGSGTRVSRPADKIRSFGDADADA